MNRIYLAAPEMCDDLWTIHAGLSEKGWIVLSSPDTDLRTQAGLLVTCQAICMTEEWWTSAICHHLQLLAQGMRLPLIHPQTFLPIGKESA